MLQKIKRTGNNITLSFPHEIVETLGISEGQEVSVEFDAKNHQIVIRPTDQPQLSGIDELFANQVNEFIEQYRPALEALARK